MMIIKNKYCTRLFSIIVTGTLFLASCRKDVPSTNFSKTTVSNNFGDLFEAYWNGMNSNYVFWSIDTTDWDRVHNQYKPLFAALDINNEQDVKLSVNYFRQMTSGLIDGHYHISFPNSPFIADSTIDPTYSRKLASPGYHDPVPLGYFFYNLPKDYLDSGYLEGVDSSVDNELEVAVTGTIKQNILYFYFSSFQLEQFYYTPNSQAHAPIKSFLDKLSQLPSNIKGIIIDVRTNGGGAVTDLDFLAGRMISNPLTFGATRAKNGTGRLDYTPWAPAIVTPYPGATSITVPIIVVADHFSVSMSELTAMAIKTLPNGKLVGETTWGANGPIAPNADFNGGQFTVSNSITVSVYTSSTMFRYINNEIYEGKGVPPDYAVPYNLASLQNGVDPQLEKAISLIP
jgi:carboxyl-terminal processing protease